MAANPPEPRENEEVIEFNLIGRGDLAVIKALTAAIDKLAQFGEQFITSDPAARANAVSRTAAPTQGNPTGAKSGVPPAAPTQAWRDPNDPLGISPYAAMPRNYGDMRGGANPQTGPGYPPPRNVEGMRGATPSGPPPRSDNRSAFQKAMDATRNDQLDEADERDVEFLSTPPARGRLDRTMQQATRFLGAAHHAPVQSALNLAGGIATAKMIGGATGNEGLGQSIMGSTIANWTGGGQGGGGGDHGASVVHNALNFAQTAALVGSTLHGRASAVAQGGTNLGYDPGAIMRIPGTDIGFRSPFEEGDTPGSFRGIIPRLAPNIRQEIDRRINVQRLRLQGGVTGRQANAIFNQLGAEGISGQEAENMAFDHVAPLVQQGQDPGLATSMLVQAARNGNTSLAEVGRTLSDLGVSARNARMNLNEYQQSLDQFSETAEQLGATKGQGLALGRNLSDAFGVAPQQAGQIIQSPLVQAMAFQRHGILPNAIGTADPTSVAEAANSAVQEAWDMTAAMFGQRTVDPITGKKISQKEANRNHAAQAAQFAGLDVETFEHTRRTGKRAVSLSEANTALQEYGGDVRDRRELEGRQARRPDGRTYDDWRSGNYARDVVRRENKVDRLRDENTRDLNTTQWKPVHEALMKAAPTDTEDKKKYIARIREIEEMKDPGHRMHQAQRLLAGQSQEALKEDRPLLDLTPAAKRLVQQLEQDDPAKREHGRGGAPTNRDRNKPDHRQKAPIGMG
jgi:hypothetical protein